MKSVKFKDEDYEWMLELINQEARAIEKQCSSIEEEQLIQDLEDFRERVIYNTEVIKD